MVIKGYRIGPLLEKTVREIGDDNVGTLAASAAYNFFFSLFPLLLFLTPLLSLVGDKKAMVGFLTQQLMSVLPAEQAAAFGPVLDKVVFAPNAPGLMSIGLVLAAWSGSNIFGTLMGALNTAYDAHETRSWIRQQLIRLMTFGVSVVIVILSTVIFLRGEFIADRVGSALRLGPAFVLAWKIAQYPVAILGLVGLTFMMFYVLPNVRQHKGYAFVGAVVATVLWIIATLLFRLYIVHFPPNPTYGLIGGVIILLTWMYYSMFVVLIGGELASELQHGTGAIAPDKGAIYLGRIVSGSGPGSVSVER
ncbi:MAG TPA: YihY/virulence factor BrkB family protein [Gemmatimonadaceae bacterium]|jgi:membrane protein